MPNPFIKKDEQKLRYDLIPPQSLQGIAKVLTYGANKYNENNWKSCDNPERYIAALYRHLEMWRQGEKLDEESGIEHLSHAMANIIFLFELDYECKKWQRTE